MAKSRARKLADLIVGAGIDIDGNLTFDGGSTSADLTFADGDKANFGDASDLQIWHNGTHSFIKDAGTGDLYIGASSNLALMNSAFTENYLLATSDGAVNLYYDGNKKFETLTGGAKVTGQLTATSDFIAADSGGTARGYLFGTSGGLFLRYNSGSNLQIQEAGSTRVTIDAGGEVGIGTTSPSQKLQVSGTGTPTIRIEETTSGGSKRMDMWVDSSTAIGYIGANQSAQSLGLQTVGSTRMLIDPSGNVGIGVTSPGLALDVYGEGRFSRKSSTSFLLNIESTGGEGRVLRFKDDGGTKYNWIAGAQYNVDNGFEITPSTAVGGATFSSPAFVIRDTGKIGIGTSSPTKLLTLGYPGADTAFEILNSGNSRMVSIGAYSANEGVVRLFNSSNVETVRIAAESTSGVHTYFNGGRVGIGTASPSEMLQIDSADSAIRVNTTNAVNNAELQLLYNNNLAHGMILHYHGNSAVGSVDNTYPRNQGTEYGDIRFRQSYAGTMTEHMRLTAYDGYLGLFTANPKARLEANLHSGADSSLMNTNSVNDVQLLRAGFGQNAATTSNAGAKWGLRFVGRNDNTFDNSKSAAVYAVSEDSLGYNRKVGLAFHTSAFDSNHAERMRIDADGKVTIGTTSPRNSAKFTVAEGKINAGTDTSVSGSVTIENYYGNGVLSAWGSTRSSGGAAMLYGVYPSTTSQTVFTSSTGIALNRGAYVVDDVHRFYTGANQTVAIGSNVTMSEVMRIETSGNLLFGQTSAIGQNTIDGGDNRSLYLCGGGTQSVGRGGNIRLHGNEATLGGYTQIYSGNEPGADLELYAYGASSELIMYTGGANPRLTIASDGRATFANRVDFAGVLIGTTAGNYVQVTGSGGSAWTMSSSGGNNTPSAAASTTFGLHHWNGSAWGEKFTVTNSGYVGIGTNNPSAPLHIDAAGMGDIYSGLVQNTTTDTDHYNVIRWMQGASGSAHGMIGTGGSTTGNAGFRNTFVVGTQNSTDLVLASADTERMRIKSDGKVAIGGASAFSGTPENTLSLIHDGHGLGFDYVGATLPRTAGLFTSSSGLTQTAWGDLNIKARTDYGNYYGIGFFTAAADNTPINRMVIKANGNVGIGTTNPGYLLAVNGSTESFALTLSDTARMTMGADGTWNYIKGKSGQGFRFSTTGASSSDVLVLQNDGQVGISTNNSYNSGALVVRSQNSGTNVDPGHGILIVNRGAYSGGVNRFIDVYTASTGSSTTLYHYIRTNINKSGNVMYRANIRGYNYGTGKILDLTAVGYAYAAGSAPTAMQNSTLHSSGATIESYYDSSNNIVLKIYVGTSSYYCGFRLDMEFTNPTGYNHDFKVTESAWSTSSTNLYT